MRASSAAFQFTAPGGSPRRADQCFPYILTRLLLGTLTIQARGRRFQQLTDYSRISPVLRSGMEAGALQSFFDRSDMNLSPSSFVRRSLGENRSFYQELLLEFSEFFWQSHVGCHAAAFIYVYRALERVSFSLPLMYCSTGREFSKTYKTLKGFFRNEEAGELAFLKELVKHVDFIDRARQDVTYDVIFSTLGADAGRKAFDFAKSLSNDWDAGDEGSLSLKIKFRHVHDLFITARNRFFHARTGDGANNLKISVISDCDCFFRPLNQVFCSYVALLSLELLAKL